MIRGFFCAALALALACGASPEGEVASRLAKAKAAEKAGQYDSAAAEYRAALALAPRNPDALHGIAEDALRRKQYAAAIHDFERALAEEPDRARTHYRIGAAYEELGELGRAQAAYRKAVDLDPSLAKARMKLADLISKENPTLAVQLYADALASLKDDPEAFYDYGNLLRGQQQHEKAAAAYEQATALKPDWAKAWNRLGGCYRSLERHADAAKAFRRALELEPADNEVRYELASALKDANQFKEAIAEFTAVLAANPKHEKALYKIASCLEKDGQTEAARAAYARAAETIAEDKELKDRAAAKALELGPK